MPARPRVLGDRGGQLAADAMAGIRMLGGQLRLEDEDFLFHIFCFIVSNKFNYCAPVVNSSISTLPWPNSDK
jgi:hypothetical protein